jgi:hypothetical protein
MPFLKNFSREKSPHRTSIITQAARHAHHTCGLVTGEGLYPLSKESSNLPFPLTDRTFPGKSSTVRTQLQPK